MNLLKKCMSQLNVNSFSTEMEKYCKENFLGVVLRYCVLVHAGKCQLNR